MGKLENRKNYLIFSIVRKVAVILPKGIRITPYRGYLFSSAEKYIQPLPFRYTFPLSVADGTIRNAGKDPSSGSLTTSISFTSP